MTRRETRLLVALCSVIVVAAAVLYLHARINEIQQTQRLTDRYLELAARLPTDASNMSATSDAESLAEREQRLEALLDLRLRMYYREGEITLFGFGTQVNRLLAANGIEVIQYAALPGDSGSDGANNEVLRYTARADAEGFLSFLEEVASNHPAWFVPDFDLSVREPDKELEVSFSIGYRVHDEDRD